MNLASFVDTTQSYDNFYALLERIFSFYDSTSKTNASVVVVSGDVNSGKTTMVKLLCEVSALQCGLSHIKDLPFNFISTHFFNIIQCDGLSVVTSDWWKIILGYKNIPV